MILDGERSTSASLGSEQVFKKSLSFNVLFALGSKALIKDTLPSEVLTFLLDPAEFIRVNLILSPIGSTTPIVVCLLVGVTLALNNKSSGLIK